MRKEVRLTISGFQGAEETVTKTEADALFFQKNDSYYLLYEETIEGFPHPFKSRIKLKGKSLELDRRGTVNLHMIFEEGKTHMTRYATPYGELLLGITAARVGAVKKAGELLAVIEYTMETQEGSLGNYRLEISAKAK